MFDESKHPRADDGKFTDGNRGTKSEKLKESERIYNSEPSGTTIQAKKKMTPAEKIASVHIDFTKDNILPELNEDTLVKIGETRNRNVLLKASSIKRNLGKHMDVSEETMQDIITEALYNPIDVFPANPNNSNYYHLASFVEIQGKNGLKMGLVLLDIDKNKNYFDIGHAYFVDGRGFDKANKKAQKKD